MLLPLNITFVFFLIRKSMFENCIKNNHDIDAKIILWENSNN